MKKEVYYLNELTGEVFTTKKECIESEEKIAKTLVEQTKDAYNTIEKYCKNSFCGTCPFANLECNGCILDWFNKDSINNTAGG